MTRAKIQSLTQLSLLAALIAAMTFIPNVGYINYGVSTITTIQIPVILGAILLGPLRGAILGAVWGVTCILNAFILGGANLMFVNPLISLLPRILVGWLAGLAFIPLARWIKVKFFPCAIAGAIGSLLNTALVISAIVLTGGGELVAFSGIVTGFVSFALSVNGIIEAIGSFVLVGVIGQALLRAKVVRRADTGEKVAGK